MLPERSLRWALAVLEACEVGGHGIFGGSKDCVTDISANLWDNTEAINDYRGICETMCAIEIYQKTGM